MDAHADGRDAVPGEERPEPRLERLISARREGQHDEDKAKGERQPRLPAPHADDRQELLDDLDETGDERRSGDGPTGGEDVSECQVHVPSPFLTSPGPPPGWRR